MASTSSCRRRSLSELRNTEKTDCNLHQEATEQAATCTTVQGDNSGREDEPPTCVPLTAMRPCAKLDDTNWPVPTPSEQESLLATDSPITEHPPDDVSLPRPSCSICGDTPTLYALLANCDHAFCVPCLRQWREQGTTSDKDELTSNFKCCPMCRTQSLLCVRSPVFVTGQAKVEWVNSIMATKSEVPCRYFSKSLRFSQGPFCPFRDDCYYLHKMGAGQFRFGVGTDQMQQVRSRQSIDRRPSLSQPSLEAELSDPESESVCMRSSLDLPGPRTTLRRSGSIGRARTRFGGSGLGVSTMTLVTDPQESIATVMSAPTSPRASSSVLAMTPTASNDLPAAIAGSGTKSRRASLAAAASAARRIKEGRSKSMTGSDLARQALRLSLTCSIPGAALHSSPASPID